MRDQQLSGRGRFALKPLFDLGQVFMTPGVADLVEAKGTDVLLLLARHLQGDWGDLDEEDTRSNQVALQQGTRLLSSYKAEDRSDVWIITEWDRSSTTILLPEEY